MADRLSKAKWLDHGLQVLAQQGPDALKANPLAQSLGVSRGSFYWHFADLGEFHADLLLRWRELTTDAVIQGTDVKLSAPEQLFALIQLAAGAQDSLERALRSWAVQDEAAALAVREVDELRVAHLVHLMCACGLPQDDAAARAAFLYWANIGRVMVGTPSSSVKPKALRAIASLLIE